MAYTWDAAGNLLSDGVYTYAYDQEQRLVGVTGPGLAWSRVKTWAECPQITHLLSPLMRCGTAPLAPSQHML